MHEAMAFLPNQLRSSRSFWSTVAWKVRGPHDREFWQRREAAEQRVEADEAWQTSELRSLTLCWADSGDARRSAEPGCQGGRVARYSLGNEVLTCVSARRAPALSRQFGRRRCRPMRCVRAPAIGASYALDGRGTLQLFLPDGCLSRQALGLLLCGGSRHRLPACLGYAHSRRPRDAVRVRQRPLRRARMQRTFRCEGLYQPR